MSHPKETILSIANENKALRWLCIFLGAAAMIAVAVVYLISRRPPAIWIVTADGKLSNNRGISFDWEVQEAARRAVEIFYISNSEREKMLPHYFSPALQEPAKRYHARDRYVAFHVSKVEYRNPGIEVEGTLNRGESDEKLLLTLTRVERTDANPFGFMISRSKKAEEQETEKKRDGLSVAESSPTFN